MITPELVEDILGIYLKHGWKISRVLLSAATRSEMGSDVISRAFGGTPIIDSDVDAVWFERPSKQGKRAIELRLLSPSPFALFELVDDSEDEDAISRLQGEMEKRLAARSSGSPGTSAH